MTEKLKPCPFCGATPKMFVNNDKEHTCYIECVCCFVRTDDYFDRKYLVKDWNSRAENADTDINSELWHNTLNSLFNAVSTIKELTKQTPYQF